MSETSSSLPPYPFVSEGKTKYGFPFWDIISRPENSFTLATASGRKISVNKSPNEIKINDENNPQAELTAEVRDGVATFRVHTEEPKFLILGKKKHPDFFAGRFIDCALAYFRINHISIHTCQGIWFSSSVNSKEFFDNLGNKKMSLAQAARNTWSGRKFIQNGFTEINDTDIVIEDLGKDSLVKASFHLSKAQSANSKQIP